jgi:hypothetical protein
LTIEFRGDVSSLSASLGQLRVVRAPADSVRSIKEIEQLSDFVRLLQWVPHLEVSPDDVLIASTDACALNVPRLHEVGDDSLCRPLRDPSQIGNIADPDLGIASDAEEYLRVACDEAPGLLIPAT